MSLGVGFRSFVDSLRANFTPTTPARALSNAAGTTNIFQPNANRPVLVTYSFRIEFDASVSDTEARVELRCDSANPPTTVRARGGLGYDIGGLLSALDARTEFQLTFLVPKGAFVALVPVTVSGSPTFSIVAQEEASL